MGPALNKQDQLSQRAGNDGDSLVTSDNNIYRLQGRGAAFQN